MDNIFSERVRNLRKSKNLKQRELGNAIGLSVQAINDIEKGRRLTALDKAVALARFFEVSLDYLVGLSDDPKRH